MSKVPDDVVRFLEHPRDCNDFTEWQQGFSPKEHLEMNRLEEQRNWQERRDKEREEDNRNWRKEREEDNRNWRRSERHWRVFEIIFVGVVVALVSAIIGGLTERGTLFPSQPQVQLNDHDPGQAPTD